MATLEQIEFIKTLRKLPKKKRHEFYYMIKGAAVVVKNVKRV